LIRYYRRESQALESIPPVRLKAQQAMVTPQLGRNRPPNPRNGSSRRGAVVVELAVMVPFLCFCFVVGLDFCRVFYYTQAVQNAAAAGASYGCQSSTNAADTNGIKAAGQADVADLNPVPKVSSSQGTDADGNATVSVTAQYTFNTITNYPGIPSSTTLKRTVTMRVCPP
jgi:Flp pilus assembly protein TadG